MASDLTKYNPIANGFTVWNNNPNFERDNPGYLVFNLQAEDWYDVGHIVYLSKPVSQWPIDMKTGVTEYKDSCGRDLVPGRYYRWLGWNGKNDDAFNFTCWEWIPALSNEINSQMIQDIIWEEYVKNF